MSKHTNRRVADALIAAAVKAHNDMLVGDPLAASIEEAIHQLNPFTEPGSKVVRRSQFRLVTDPLVRPHIKVLAYQADKAEKAGEGRFEQLLLKLCRAKKVALSGRGFYGDLAPKGS